jgi:hypothetical protein
MGRNASVIMTKDQVARANSDRRVELGLLREQAARIEADITKLEETKDVYKRNLKEVQKQIKDLEKK